MSSNPSPWWHSIFIANRKNEYARYMDFVPEQIWSRELELLIITLCVLSKDTFWEKYTVWCHTNCGRNVHEHDDASPLF